MALLKPWTWGWLKNKVEQHNYKDKPKTTDDGDTFSTNLTKYRNQESEKLIQWISDNMFQKTHADLKPVDSKGCAMTTDSAITMDNSIKEAFTLSASRLPPVLFSWYVQQGFIGYQACGIIAQNWLVDKACSIPGKAALKKGYEISVNSGEKVDNKVVVQLREMDDKFKIDKNLAELNKMNRIFGIRIALFKVKTKDKDYYQKPFNIDGVEKGSYEGIVQVDPYWITPELSAEAVSNPASMRFYEPTWWRINGNLYHYTHLIITKYSEVADILKPTYIYGGLPLTQLIYERAYAAERTANEGPMLALTKRVNVVKTDTKAALADFGKFEERLMVFNENRDNHGTYVIDKEEQFEQTDTALSDLDVTIMTQYQLVAAIADIPAVELLETSPKGFNATGEFEQDSYYDSLECIQKNEYTPLLNRHYQLLIKSEGINSFNFSINWNPLKSPTTKEVAEINEINSRTDLGLITAGAIDGVESRDRLIADEDSGYNGLEAFEFGDDEPDEFNNEGLQEGVLEEGANGNSDKTIEQVSLNGAQVTSIVDIVSKISTEELSRDSGLEILATSFPISRQLASKIIGSKDGVRKKLENTENIKEDPNQKINP